MFLYLVHMLSLVQHRNVIFYYLRKKHKYQNLSICRYTTTDYFFKMYIYKTYKNYYPVDGDKGFPTQYAFARSNIVNRYEESLINTIKELSTHVGLFWHLVN